MRRAVNTVFLTVLALFGSSVVLGSNRDFNSGCMDVQSFAQWSRTQRFPYRATLQRATAIRAVLKRIDLGTSADGGNTVLPKPDWAVETMRGCVWKFVIRMPNADGLQNYRGVAITFREAKVVGLAQENGNPWELVEH